MSDLRLIIRTPTETVVDCGITALTAEDATGRFGVRPGMEPLVAALVPSLLLYRCPDEALVCVGRGLLVADRRSVRVTVRRAVCCASLDDVEVEIDRAARVEHEADVGTRGAFRALYDHLRRSLVDEERA